MTSHLYLLVFPEPGMIKVGKADVVHERIRTLRRFWGEVDYEASYQLASQAEVVFRLEKSLGRQVHDTHALGDLALPSDSDQLLDNAHPSATETL